ncbi:MAG: lamin tail domain-containing protein [Salinirussus sp.]
MNRLVIGIALLIISAGCTGIAVDPGSPPSTAGEPTGTGTPLSPSSNGLVVTVTDVVDGDTIDVRYQNGTSDTVRLLGIDTPEVHVENDPAEFEGVPETDAGATCLREAGHAASEYVDRRLEQQKVTLVFDNEADRRGSYGRLLAYVTLDGRNINLELVAEGYARVYDSEFTHADRFYAAESEAQSAVIGLWQCTKVGSATPIATAESNALSLMEIHADAAGNDNENLNDEFIVFENTGEQPLELAGWTISDAAGHTYVVPSGVSLDPGQMLTLYTGDGTDNATALYWGSETAIWNNDGDTVFVSNSTGQLRLERSYS